ncbi:ATP-binding cassette domain-containing protein [Canibacter sp. lx-72]|uniref:ABC transporter ATP-binding protein n=1 Tax=Canibacter zhuwentaonis TaxID=2837491 RepID=UPI001BDCEA93|nr:ATP-binding cassette domain-containing protein [Canibacter zhuwentaonis]MBT1017966.1 ATP-binding cassette domain-containing protein [Canibacter zhuwentaonis]MBT1035127.1 ATP-binding cassette domain-containing protein [Canibacter zhuwentaonis]
MINFNGVSKVYPTGSIAVENFSLRVKPHKTVALVGSSGSGKSTLLRMVNRMIEPSSGEVLINGQDISTADPVQLRRSIGYVLQNSGLLPHRTVLNNVAAVPLLCGSTKQQARSKATELLELVGIDTELLARYPAELSGGQQQRVGVARALAADPDILLMDEPFGAVDPIVRRELQAETLRLKQELNKTIMFVTHDIEEAFIIGDEIVLLETGGKIAQHGTPQDLITNPANDFVRDFIGFSRRNKQLTIIDSNGVKLVQDSHGLPLGVLS